MPSLTRSQARQLRQSSTDAEAILWYRLRGGRLGGFKFRRQHPVPPFIADFCCVAEQLIVELDGSQHGDSDASRDEALRGAGFRVLRYWNNQVFEQLEDVLAEILAVLHGRTLTPDPSPTGEGRINQGECA